MAASFGWQSERGVANIKVVRVDGTSENSLNSAYRVIDANANRAAEGLRTIEEMSRMILDDATLTASLKHLRHRLQAIIDQFDLQKLLAARNTAGDVGTRLQDPRELARSDFDAIVHAAAGRTQQALRCLEEFAKLIQPPSASLLEQLRYEAYDVLAKAQLQVMEYEQRRAADALNQSNGASSSDASAAAARVTSGKGGAVGQATTWQVSSNERRLSRQHLVDARLCLLIDGSRELTAFQQHCREVAEAGCDIIQIRDKQMETRRLIAYVQAAIEAVRHLPTAIIVNDRLDVAMITKADGVHLGQDDMGIAEARRIVGDSMWIGGSTHDIEQARDAMAMGADYIGCGPTFPSQTKAFQDFPGLAFLKQWSLERQVFDQAFPAFAIGGIQLENLDEVLATGIRRIAVSHVVAAAPRPAEVVRHLKKRLLEVILVKNRVAEAEFRQ